MGNIDPDQWNICGKSYYYSILLLKIINIWYVGYSIFNIFYSIFFQAEILQSKNLSKVTPTKIRLDKHFVFWYVNLARLLVQGRFTNHANKFFGHYWTTTSLDSNSIMFCVPQGPFSRLMQTNVWKSCCMITYLSKSTYFEGHYRPPWGCNYVRKNFIKCWNSLEDKLCKLCLGTI